MTSDFSETNESQNHFMPPQDRYLTTFDVADSTSDFITQSMNNMRKNDYNVNRGEVRKYGKVKPQNSSELHYSQMLDYEESFDNVNQINLPRTLPIDNQALNTKTSIKMGSMMRSNYQNHSTNATKKLLTKTKVSRLTKTKLFIKILLSKTLT